MKRKAHWILAITLAALIVLPSCTSVAGITEEERARLIEGSVFTPQVETIVEYQPYEVVRTVYVDNGTVEKVTETTQPSTGNPVDDANAEATTTVVSQADFQNAIAQYAFSDGLIYGIFTSPGFVTDIRLAPGETISGNAAIGDSERWQLETAVSSENGRRTTHIYVKPVTIGVETSMIIPTDQRTYYLHLKSFENMHMTGVRWTYPQITTFTASSAESSNPAIAGAGVTIGVDPSKLNFGYYVTGSNTVWKPTSVFDDGVHTYIQFDPRFEHSAGAPTLYLLPSAISTQSQVEAVNYVIQGNMYITDFVLQDKQVWCLIADDQTVKIRRN